MYFGRPAHDAIVEFQNTDIQKEKHEIYVSKIKQPFNKLVENLIFIHGFKSLTGSYEDLKNDCVTFLYETLHKFDPTKGSKAFSYFNVVAKNWLIIRSKKNTREMKRSVSIDDTEILSQRDKIAIEMHSIAESQDAAMIRKNSIENLFLLLDEIKSKTDGTNEILCINAIITVFKSIDDLDFLNKRAVFVYLRDISGLSPKQLSVSMSSIRKHYRAIKKDDRFDIFFGE
jgi:tRNA splicing endonuclease